MAAEAYERIRAAIKNLAGTRLLSGRALDRGEILALSDGCTSDRNVAAGVRDAALIAMLYASGLRRAEIAALTLGQYDPEDGAVRVLSGKGDKDRITYVGDQAAREAIGDWLLLRGDAPGALFCPVNKAGRVLHRGMTPAAVRLILAKRVRYAVGKVDPATPHDMRRSFISDLLDAGSDLSTVQKLAGHANPATTAGYDRRGEVAKRKAASLLHFPYHSPLKNRQRGSPP